MISKLNQTVLPLLITLNEHEYEALVMFANEKLEIQKSIKQRKVCPDGLHLGMYRYMNYIPHNIPHLKNALIQML